MLVKMKITRPKYAKDKNLSVGMSIFQGENGILEARKRAPKGGGIFVGVLVQLSFTDGDNHVVGVQSIRI